MSRTVEEVEAVPPPGGMAKNMLLTWIKWGLLALVAGIIGYRLWQRRGVAFMSVHELKSRIDARDKYLLIDLREPSEFRLGHIHGAVSIPIGSLYERIGSLRRTEEVILVDKFGPRSYAAYHRLKAMGFTDVRAVEGGMLRWAWDVDQGG